MPNRIQLFGAPELFSTFSKLGDALATKYIGTAIHAGVEVTKDSVIRKAPFRTGMLRSQVNILVVSATRTRVVQALSIGPGAFYWRYLEFGARRHGAVTRTGAHPFVRQAFKNRRTTAIQTIRDTFRDQVLGFKD